jgi:hypothetical protein
VAVAVIIISTLSIIATIMAWLALAPVMQEFGTDMGEAGQRIEEAGQQATNARDLAFQAVIVLPIFIIGAIVCWAFLAVTRRDYGEY